MDWTLGADVSQQKEHVAFRPVRIVLQEFAPDPRAANVRLGQAIKPHLDQRMRPHDEMTLTECPANRKSQLVVGDSVLLLNVSRET